MDEALAKLHAGDAAAAAAASALLVKIFANLIKSPGNEKYRRLRTTNPKIEAAIVRVAGALDVLLAAGFAQSGEWLEIGGDDATVLAAAQRARDAPRRPRRAPAGFVPLARCARWPMRAPRAGDGRLASGGLDNVVRVWDAEPPLAGAAERASNVAATARPAARRAACSRSACAPGAPPATAARSRRRAGRRGHQVGPRERGAAVRACGHGGVI